MKVVFMFSGQGSQYYRMGQRLYDQNKDFRLQLEELDEMGRQIQGISVLKEIYHSSKKISDPFDELMYTHPAIFMVEYALAQVLINYGVQPDYLLGTSLGEFSAAVLSGVLSKREGLALIFDQAKSITDSCHLGGMLAVIHNPDMFYSDPVLYRNVELGGVSNKNQFLVTGGREKLEFVKKHLNSLEIVYQELMVPYAFHSSGIDAAEQSFKERLSQVTMKSPGIPLVSCAHLRILNQVPSAYFWDIIRKPILFSQLIEKMEGTGEELLYLDLGPSGTMANFIKYSVSPSSKSENLFLMSPFGDDTKRLTDTVNYVANITASVRSMPSMTGIN